MNDRKPEELPEEKPPVFDIDGKDDPKFTTSAQSFNRIKAIQAVSGMVLVLVDDERCDVGVMTQKLKPVLMSVREAAQRALGLNRMIGKLPAKSDKDVANEIVEATMSACKEAQRQKQEPKVFKKARGIGFSTDPGEILEAAFPKEAKFTAALAKQKGVTVGEMRATQLSELTKSIEQNHSIKSTPLPSDKVI